MTSDGLVTNICYRNIKIAACSGFIFSGVLNMIECSERILIPQLDVLGTYIAFFKIAGSVAFLVSSVMGLSDYAKRMGPIASPVNALWGEQDPGTEHPRRMRC